MKAIAAATIAASAILCWPGGRARGGVLVESASRRDAPRRAGDAEGECLAVLDSMIVLLQAGTPQGQALDLATRSLRSARTDTAEGWQELADVARADGDVVEVWTLLGKRWGCPTFTDVAAAWQMSTRHGCPLATALESAAGGVRAARRHRGSIEGAVAGARATMGVLTALPLLGVGLGLLLGVDMASVYTGASGLVTLWPGLGLLWCGRRWATTLVRRALTAGGGSTVPA